MITNRVSVVIAVYKGGDYLTQQIKSIVNGIILPNEIVIVDDCPEAPSDIPAKMIEDAGVLLKYSLNKKNLGPTLSFVEAVNISRGDIVFFCDQDDVWNPNKLASLLPYFEDKECVLAYSDGVITNANLEASGNTIFTTRKRADLSKGNSRNAKEFFSNPDIKGCMMAFRGSFAKEVFSKAPNNFSTYWGHDHWLAVFAYVAKGIRVHKESLFLHRFHDNNSSSAVRFSIFNLNIFKRYLHRAQLESPKHYFYRYNILRNQYLGNHQDAVLFFVNAEKLRLNILKKAKPFRFFSLLRLLDYYKQYRNGWASFIRDWLITPKFVE